MNGKEEKEARKIIEEIYQTYNPSKVDSIDALLEKYKGKEKKLIAALRKKYAKTTLPTDFFDEKPKESPKAEKVSNKEWKDFQAFAKSINENKEIEENDTRDEERIEQNQFLERVESIKRKRKDTNANNEKKNESDTILLGLLRKRKEKRKRRRMNAAASQVSKLDPLDWRSKSTVS